MANGWSQKSEVGKASYMSDLLQGNRTAYGEVYDKDDFTAASKTFQHNDVVRVTRLDNNRSVMVRINDKGPNKGNRIIDLSSAAAARIGLINDGITQVRVTLVEAGAGEKTKEGLQDQRIEKPKKGLQDQRIEEPKAAVPMQIDGRQVVMEELPSEPVPIPESEPRTGRVIDPMEMTKSDTKGSSVQTQTMNTKGADSRPVSAFSFGAQLGAFSSLENAQDFASEMVSKGLDNIIVVKKKSSSGKLLHYVAAGPFLTKPAAEAEVARLKKRGIRSFVITLGQ